jgi:hypothetical protein
LPAIGDGIPAIADIFNSPAITAIIDFGSSMTIHWIVNPSDSCNWNQGQFHRLAGKREITAGL